MNQTPAVKVRKVDKGIGRTSRQGEELEQRSMDVKYRGESRELQVMPYIGRGGKNEGGSGQGPAQWQAVYSKGSGFGLFPVAHEPPQGRS